MNFKKEMRKEMNKKENTLSCIMTTHQERLAVHYAISFLEKEIEHVTNGLKEIERLNNLLKNQEPTKSLKSSLEQSLKVLKAYYEMFEEFHDRLS